MKVQWLTQHRERPRNFEAQNSYQDVCFSLDSFAWENYTFISCFMHVNATSMATSIGSAGKRNQGKASQ